MGASLALMNSALLVMGASLALVAADEIFRAAQGYSTVPKPHCVLFQNYVYASVPTIFGIEGLTKFRADVLRTS